MTQEKTYADAARNSALEVKEETSSNEVSENPVELQSSEESAKKGDLERILIQLSKCAEKFFENLLKQQLINNHTVFDENEAAVYCRISVESLRYHALRSRKLTWVKVSKEHMTFLKRDLDAFLENSREETSRDQ